MNSRFLDTLVWLSRLKSFSKTAEKLNATQPAIWNRIAKLEESLGVALYVHGAKEFQLSDAAKLILPEAERLLEIADNIINLARSEGPKTGSLRIGIVELAVVSWLPIFIRLVEEQLPLVTIRLITDTTPMLIQALEKDEVDLAILFGPVYQPHIVNISAGTYPVAWIASPVFYDCNTVISVGDLVRMPLISVRRESSGFSMLESYFSSHGISWSADNYQRRVAMENVYSPYSAIHVVRAGMGITALPPLMCAAEIERSEIAILPVYQKLPKFEVTACYKNPMTSAVIGEVARLIREAAHAYANDVSSDYFEI